MNHININRAKLLAFDDEFRARLASMRGNSAECRSRARSLWNEDAQIDTKVVGMLADFLGEIKYKDFVQDVYVRILDKVEKSEADSLQSDNMCMGIRTECLSQLLNEFVSYVSSRGLSAGTIEVEDDDATFYQTSQNAQQGAESHSGSTQSGSSLTTRANVAYQTEAYVHTVAVAATVVVAVAIVAGAPTSIDQIYLNQVKSIVIDNFTTIKNGSGNRKSPLPISPHDIRNLFTKIFEAPSHSDLLKQLH